MLDEDYGLFYIGNRIIELTEMETRLLSILIENKERIATYEIISQALYGRPLDHKTETSIKGLAMRTRKRLGDVLEIIAKTKLGYMIRIKGEKPKRKKIRRDDYRRKRNIKRLSTPRVG